MYKYLVENVLSIALVVTVTLRSLLTIFPNKNPLPLDNQRCLDILVLVICIFLPIQCFLSATGVSHFLKPRMIMKAIFRSACPHFRKKVCDIVALRVNTQTVVVFLLMMLSLAYALCHAFIIYEQCDYRLPLYVRVLELMIPAVALSVQSFGQGCVLLFTSLCPVASKSLHKMNQIIFIKEIHFHMVLNVALLVNPIAMVLTDIAKEHITWVFLGLATSELIYRVYSVYSFHKIAMDNAVMKHVYVHTQDLLLVRGCEYTISQLLSTIWQQKKPAKTATGDAVVSAHFSVPLDQFTRMTQRQKSGNKCKKEHKLLCREVEWGLEQYYCTQSKKLKLD